MTPRLGTFRCFPRVVHDLADDHHVVVFLESPSAVTAAELRAAGVPPARFRPAQPRVTTMADTPAVASMS